MKPYARPERRDVVLRAVGLTKRFGRVVALDGLDLEVGAGEVHAFLGPNGAGKTTTIRVLMGLLKADAGEVTLLGGDPWRDAVELHRRLAYVPGDLTLWPSLTGGEIIDLLGRLRGGIDARRRRALTERFDLDTSTKARAYSRGNRQKVALIAALASRAELLLLDEPTAGLDPLMEATFRECVNEERHDGRTILLSSHILAEAEALADRVTIIRDGRAVETGTLADPVLATATGRIRWALSHISIAVGGACLLLTTAGLSAGLSYGTLTRSVSTQVPRLLGAAAARLPATMTLAAVAVLLFGLLPWEATGLAWTVVALAGVITVFGPPLQWPAWTMDISPFTQTPKLPGGTVPAEPLLWLCGITLALATAGLAGLRHRDIGDFGPSRLSCLLRDWIAGDTHQNNELPHSAAARGTAQPPGTTGPDTPPQPPHQAHRTG
jgi:ABC-2 type transport system ATP-binding protein